MLRLKRTVQAAFADRAVVLPGNQVGAKRPREGDELPPADSMARLEADNTEGGTGGAAGKGGFVSAGLVDNWSVAGGSAGLGRRGMASGRVAFDASAKFTGARAGYVFKSGAQGVGYYRDGPSGDGALEAGGVAEEIDIDEEEEEEEILEVEQRAVPAEVFGSAGLGVRETMGALARMRRKQGEAA
jgi:hypothetical protein